MSSAASECGLETQNWDELLSTQPSVPTPREGGEGNLDPASEIIYGELIMFVPTQEAAARICGAKIGANSGKKCLLVKDAVDKCSVAKHNAQGPERALKPGFYLRAGPSARDRDYILEEPVGDASLFAAYGDLILGSRIRSSEFWLCAFGALASAPNTEAGISSFKTLEESHAEFAGNMATLDELPTLEEVIVKREDQAETFSSPPDIVEASTMVHLSEMQLHEKLKENFGEVAQHVDDVMTSMASTMNLPFRHDASIKALLSFGFVESKRINENKVDVDVYKLKQGIMEADQEDLTKRVNNLSSTVGAVDRSWKEYKKPSQVPLYFEELNATSNWDVMLHLFNMGKQGARQLGKVEKSVNKEFKGMFRAFAGLAARVESLKDSMTRMKNANQTVVQDQGEPEDSHKGSVFSRYGVTNQAQPSQVTFDSFKEDPAFLQWSLDFSAKFNSQVEEVKAQLDSSDSMTRAFPFEGHVFRNPGDFQARMDMFDTKVPFGGFCCLFNVLYRVYVRTTSSDFEGELKKNKMIRESNSPKAEALSEYCLKTVIPTIFGTEQPSSGKSDLSGLPSYAHWKKPKTRHGLFYQLSELLPVVKRECTSLINKAYPSGNRDQFFRRLAIDILNQSMNTIEALMRWIDETHEVLTGVGGNSNDAAWFIITKIIRHLFERLFAPARLAPMGLDMEGKNEKGCLVLWAIVQTHMISEDLEIRNIKDHPIVVGAYTEWIVANSGRREAEEVRALNLKLTAQVESLSKDLESTKKKLDSVKGSADRALLAVSKNK